MASNNQNRIITDHWSSAASDLLYRSQWPEEPVCREQYDNGKQCGGCAFFAAFGSDWGLCANGKSRHHLETVFEHFTCPGYVDEGWGPHSFTEDASFHCRCGGEGSEYWDGIAAIFDRSNDASEP